MPAGARASIYVVISGLACGHVKRLILGQPFLFA